MQSTKLKPATVNEYIQFQTQQIKVFKDELKNYKTSKGTIQFQLDKPLPKKLITEIMKFRIKENAE